MTTKFCFLGLGVAGRRRLVAKLGGLMLGFALHLVYCLFLFLLFLLEMPVVLQCAIVDCGSGDPPGSRLVLLDAVIAISL